MYLQWSKIDVGQADFREANRLFFIFWEACKADDKMLMECATLKIDEVAFLLWRQGKRSTLATISSDARFGVLSKSGADAKKMFTDKIVPISVNYPFFLQTDSRWDGPTKNRTCL